MGKKSQEQMLGSKQERVDEAIKREEEIIKKELEQAVNTIQTQVQKVATTGSKDVDKKPEDIILEKVEKHPQLTFKQKVEAFRNRRRRKQFQQRIEQLNMPVKTPEEKPKEEVKTTIQTVAYRCKDCKEVFTGDPQIDTCIACNSKNLEKIPEYELKEVKNVVCEECAKKDCEIRGQGNKRMPCSDYIEKKGSK